MKHLKRFNENSSQMPDKFTVSSSDLSTFVRKDKNPNYPNFEYYSDRNKGHFDSEKGAMTDYPVFLTNGQDTWKSIGGYYTGVTGEQHDYDLTFTKIEKEKTLQESSKEFAKKIFDFCKIDIDQLDPEYIDVLSEMIIQWHEKNK